MTFEEWSAAVQRELTADGYTVSEHEGFPLVRRPQEWAAGVRLIKWRSPSGLPCAKRIYAEGMLFVPGELS